MDITPTGRQILSRHLTDFRCRGVYVECEMPTRVLWTVEYEITEYCIGSRIQVNSIPTVSTSRVTGRLQGLRRLNKNDLYGLKGFASTPLRGPEQ